MKKLISYFREHLDTFADVQETVDFIERVGLTLNAAGITAQIKLKTIDEALTDCTFKNCEKLREAEKIIAISIGTNTYT